LKRLLRAVAATAAGLLGIACAIAPASAAPHRTIGHPIDRIFYIMMENQGFDEVIGRHDSVNVTEEDTPFITALAENNGLSLLQFGTTHPSLPNYLAAISGQVFNNHDDSPSCFAIPRPTGPCHAYHHVSTLVDSLEAAHMTWSAYFQTMPGVGSLVVQWPASPGPALYAQKHNPFVYFSNIVENKERMADLKPMDMLASDLALGALAPQFEFIVPDQCHDMHGQPPCENYDELLREGDTEVKNLVGEIEASPAFTADSLIIVTWDEDDYSSTLGCCDSPKFPNGTQYGGGHTATIIVSDGGGTPLRSTNPYNEYSLLSTIENIWGLPLLGNTADTVNVQPEFDLIH
jgi:phospholipase C